MIAKDELVLRRYRQTDRANLVQLADNPNVSRYLDLRFPCPYSLADADNWLAFTASQAQPLNLAVQWQGKLVGGIGIEPHSGIHARTAELGYWLGEPYWGKGLAANAVELFTPYVFNELGFIRLQAMVFAENPNSRRVLEKCGFTREGVLRRHICKHGKVTDAFLYAKLAGE